MRGKGTGAGLLSFPPARGFWGSAFFKKLGRRNKTEIAKQKSQPCGILPAQLRFCFVSVFIAVILPLSSASAGEGKYQTGRGKRRRGRYPGWAYVPSDNPAGKLWWDRRTGHRHSTTYNNPRYRHHPALCSRWNHPAACRSTGRPGCAG